MILRRRLYLLSLGKWKRNSIFSKFRDNTLQAHKEEKGKTIEELATLFFSKQAEEANEDLNNEDIVMKDKSLEELESELDSLPISEPSIDEAFEEPEKRGDEELPPPELKILPGNLKYRFLDDTNRFPVIISAKLSGGEEEELMKVLREHRIFMKKVPNQLQNSIEDGIPK